MRAVNARSSKRAKLKTLRLGLACWALVLGATLASVAQDGRPSATTASTANSQPEDAKARPAKDSKPAKGSTADSDKKKQIADGSAELLKMALALKAEVDKTTKDTLSLNVIKKADEIEKLAKQVKEKMKQSSGS
jgi:hypothetical protein